MEWREYVVYSILVSSQEGLGNLGTHRDSIAERRKRLRKMWSLRTPLLIDISWSEEMGKQCQTWYLWYVSTTEIMGRCQSLRTGGTNLCWNLWDEHDTASVISRKWDRIGNELQKKSKSDSMSVLALLHRDWAPGAQWFLGFLTGCAAAESIHVSNISCLKVRSDSYEEASPPEKALS